MTSPDPDLDRFSAECLHLFDIKNGSADFFPCAYDVKVNRPQRKDAILKVPGRRILFWPSELYTFASTYYSTVALVLPISTVVSGVVSL